MRVCVCVVLFNICMKKKCVFFFAIRDSLPVHELLSSGPLAEWSPGLHSLSLLSPSMVSRSVSSTTILTTLSLAVSKKRYPKHCSFFFANHNRVGKMSHTVGTQRIWTQDTGEGSVFSLSQMVNQHHYWFIN